jgi:hypothetical protein
METELKMAATAAVTAAAGGIVKAASSGSDLEISATNHNQREEVAAAPVPGRKAVPAPVPPAFAGLNGGVRRKTVVVPVSIEAIRALEKRRPRPPTTHHPRGLPEHLLWRPAGSLEEQELRDGLAESAAIAKALYDKEAAILEQYLLE